MIVPEIATGRAGYNRPSAPSLMMLSFQSRLAESVRAANKAAHVGHLRNATLGDTLVRVLRHRGREVGVQNYIDDTGVQVADVVVGFLHLEKKSLGEVEELAASERFDYLCWDLYARVGDF